MKRIEVASVVADDNPNAAFVRLLAVDVAKSRAQLTINHGIGGSFKTKKVWVKQGDDLAVVSDGRQEYANGWIVADISFRSGAEVVEFTNGSEVTIGEASASFDEDVRKAQVVETVRQHLDKERTLAPLGVKVLSLFFIDKVANYRAIDEQGNPALGPIGQWFEEAYTDLASRPRYASLTLPPVSLVHDGYFSVDNKQRPKDTRGDSADVETYDLIMRDKERLLSADEPLRFIFSHSALREGWDNPNVFQICTLNESKSTDRKRQEIGRGLRLPVNQDGERIHDPLINRLTIVANEAYDQFARALQTEYEEDTGQRFGIVPKHAFARLALPSAPGEPPRAPIGQRSPAEVWEHLQAAGYLDASGVVLPKFDPSAEDFELDVPDGFEPIRAEITDAISRFVFANRVIDAKKRQTVRFRKQVTLDPEFKALWDRISKRTKYRVSLSSDLVDDGSVRDRRRRSDRGRQGAGPGRRARAQRGWHLGRQAGRPARLRHRCSACTARHPRRPSERDRPHARHARADPPRVRPPRGLHGQPASVHRAGHFEDQRGHAHADGRRHPVRADPRPALGDAPPGT